MGFGVFSYTSKGTQWKVFTIHLSAATSHLYQQCCCFHLKSGFLAVKHVRLWKQKSPNFLTKIQPTRSPWLFTSHLFKWPWSLRSSGPCKPSSSNPNPEERCSHLLFWHSSRFAGGHWGAWGGTSQGSRSSKKMYPPSPLWRQKQLWTEVLACLSLL